MCVAMFQYNSTKTGNEPDLACGPKYSAPKVEHGKEFANIRELYAGKLPGK